ncbi:MAG: OsmC family protein [Spirochaetes bacterium]|nr:OsmC family protein [Spirochaetota bacterium]
MKINTKWLGGMAFESVLNGHKIIMDADKDFGGEDRGPRPKGLLLVALAGCTGMDVVSLLNKMQVPISRYEMDIETETTEDHPRVFKDIKIVYKFWGNELKNYKDKIEKAINLSQEKYCGVSAMLKKNSNIIFTYEILEDL